ncbi:MAG: hypothetical protein RLZZ200_948 [Pseudomonadota bacterium]|jgi:hypothetical protein
MKKKKAWIDAAELDAKFDSGEDITPYLDLSTVTRPNRGVMRVNVDFPQWMVKALDREAERVGVTRQSIIKVWLAERLAAAPTPAAVQRRRGKSSR